MPRTSTVKVAVFRHVIVVRIVEERLGRDAPDVETSAAQGVVLLHAHRLHAQLRRLDRRHIAARAAADHDKVYVCNIVKVA